MKINRDFKKFKLLHKNKENQNIYTSKKVKNDYEILNLIDNFLEEKNSFIFESVEKGKIKGRYTIFGKNPDKVWEFNDNNAYIIKKNKKGSYIHFKIKGKGKVVAELEKNEAIDKKLLRYLTVKVKKFDLDTNYFAKRDDSEKIEKKERVSN